MWLWQNFETECSLQHFTRNWKNKNLDDFERAKADTYLRWAGVLNVKEKGMTICYIMDRSLIMFLREEAVNVVEYWWNIQS